MVFTRLTLFFPWNKESRFERGANKEGRNRTTLHTVGEPRQVISLCPDLTFSSVGYFSCEHMHACRRLTCFLGTVHSQERQFLLRLASAGSFWQRATNAGSDHNSAFPKCMRSVLSLLCPTPQHKACREMTAEAIKCLRCAFSAC